MANHIIFTANGTHEDRSRYRLISKSVDCLIGNLMAQISSAIICFQKLAQRLARYRLSSGALSNSLRSWISRNLDTSFYTPKIHCLLNTSLLITLKNLLKTENIAWPSIIGGFIISFYGDMSR